MEPRARRVPALRERPPARVLEPAAPAADRERHLRRVRRHAELGEEPAEQRVVQRVVDEEPGVERDPVDDDRVRVPARARLPLEQLDLVRAREHVRRTEARDPAADDRYPHNRHSSRCEYWLPMIDAPVPAIAPLPALRHRPPAHEPHQPGRHADRGRRPAARGRRGRRSALERRLPPRRPARSWPECTSSARSASRSASTATSPTAPSRRSRPSRRRSRSSAA